MKKLTIAVQAALAAAFVTGCATDARAPGYSEVQPFQRVSGEAGSDAWYQLGRYHQGQSRWSQAETAFRHVLALDAGHADAHNALGAVLAARGLLAAAEVEFQAASRAAPQAAHIRGNLGRILLLQGRAEEAVATLEEAARLDPANLSVRSNLVAALAEAGKSDAAHQPALADRTSREPVVVAPLSSVALVSAVAAPGSLMVTPPAPTNYAVVVLPAVPLGDSRSLVTQVQTVPAAAPVALGGVAYRDVNSVSPPAASALQAPVTVRELAPPLVAEKNLLPLEPVVKTPERSAVVPAQLAEKTEKSAVSRPPESAASVAAATPVAARGLLPSASSEIQPKSALERSPRVRLEVSNGNGVTGMAKRVRKTLSVQGYPAIRITNLLPYRQQVTAVQYRVGFEPQARALGERFPQYARVVYQVRLDPRADVRIVLGRDLPRSFVLNDAVPVLLAAVKTDER